MALERRHLIIQLIFSCLIILRFVPSWSAVMGIDYSSDLIKVSAVVPGKSFDIVLDESSKRSHPSLVVFDDDVRQYGTSASSLVVKRPLRSFLQHSRLMGKAHDSKMIDELRSNFIFNEVVADEKRKTVRFVNPYFDASQSTADNGDEEGNILNIIAAEPSISVEEIATMKLKHIKKIAEAETEAKDLKDCVITVPEFWSYKERQSLLDASQMAGLNVLGLINENTAAALQYALKQKFEEDKTDVVVFYNMGAVSTKVSVIKYFTRTPTKKKKNKKTNDGKGAFEVLAQSWDETLGGINFDRAIANIVIERAFVALADRKNLNVDFADSEFQDKMRVDPRFTARIMKASGRAKKILSANTETMVSIEGIYDDEDFRTTITRDELYEKCGDLFVRALKPLENAVASSGYDKEDIESIVLVGGSTRIPKIREMLTNFLGKPLKEDLNADEAPAFGAAFRGANLSSTFRVRAVGMDDITPFAVGVRLKDLHPPSDPEEKAFKKRGSLFSENNHLFRRRAVTLKHGADLKVELFYEKSAPLPMDTSRDLGYYEVSGVGKAVEKYMNIEKYNITELPKISLSFLLDANGIVDLVKATAEFTEWVTEEKAVKPKKSKKSKSKKSEGDDEDGDTEADDDEDEGDKSEDKEDGEESDKSEDDEKSEESNEASDDTEGDKEETETVHRKRTHRVDLNAERTRPEDVKAMESADFASSAKLLLELDDRDRSVLDTADARNDLESYIFESRNRLYDDKNVEKVSTETEREEFRAVLTEAEDWIWDQEEETAGIFKSKIRELKKIGGAIFMRADEIDARPQAIDAAGKTLGQLYESVEMLRTNYSWVNSTEIDKLEAMTKKAETWLNEKIEEQDEQSLMEKPVFLSAEVYYKVEPAVEFAKKLLSRPKPYGWGKKKKSKNATNTTEANATMEGAESEEDLTAEIKVDTEGGDEVDEEGKEEESEETEGDDSEGEKEDL